MTGKNYSGLAINRISQAKSNNLFSTMVNNSKIQAEGRFCYIRSDEA
jgi:hypothetical protein